MSLFLADAVGCPASTILPINDNYSLTLRAARSARRRAEGEARPRPGFLVPGERDSWRWESGKPAFGFPLFHPPASRRSCGNVGISPVLGEISKGLWKEGEACFWLSTLSTVPAFPQLAFPGAFFALLTVAVIRPRPCFPPVDSSWHAPPGSSGCSAQ